MLVENESAGFHIRKLVAPAAILALVVFVTSFAGILSRPEGQLAALWPANAVLLGIMVRNPQLSTPAGWGAAILAYIFADLITGGDFAITVWLTTANLVGVVTGLILYRQLSTEHQRLQRPLSVLYLLMVCLVASLCTALVGGGAAYLIFGRDFITGLEFWFVTELVNSLIILPSILTCPSPAAMRLPSFENWKQLLRKILPVASLAPSVLVSIIVGGPGAIAYPLPALLWCALSYGLFSTALITFVLCSWILIGVTFGWLAVPQLNDFIEFAISLRLGVALISLAPLTVASINCSREQLLKKLTLAANHDYLTGVMSRGAFFQAGAETLERAARDNQSTNVLMLDIDHFKSINDEFGHATGDQVLVRFAETTGQCLRSTDLIGRMGGEEFAVILPNTSGDTARAIAERVCASIGDLLFEAPDNQSFAISVSVGLAESTPSLEYSLEQLIAEADRALYAAKASGRNKVVGHRE